VRRNGENINAVRTATGAMINLDKLEDFGEAIVTFRGENSGVAYRMVEALLHEPVWFVWDLQIWKMGDAETIVSSASIT